jgi:dTDP-4-dehydrorhamnose 3,5-epimerase
VFKISKKLVNFLLFLSIGFLCLIAISGCSSGNLNPTNSIKDAQENTLTRVQDMPFVLKTKLHINESLIMGEGKLITVMSGKIFDVALDCRVKSRTFGQFFAIELSEKENISLYIPEGFAHGFCSLVNNTVLHYRCTNYRDKSSETGIYWKDKNLSINWPKKKFLVSPKDKKNLLFKNLIKSKKFNKIKW